MAPDKVRVLVLGLDGGTWDVFDPLMDRGIMPNLQSVVGRGLRAELRSTIPPMTPPAWATFQTGTNPGKHGVIDFNLYRPGSTRVPPVNRRTIDGKSLWRRVSDGGGTVGIVNVPLTYPPEPVNGFLISGFDSPRGYQSISYPNNLMEDLGSAGYDTGYDLKVYQRDGLAGLVRELNRLTAVQVGIVQRLMTSRPWDLFMYQFQLVDHLQHCAWHVLDPKDPRHAEASDSDRFSADMFYAEVDRHIGTLLEAAGPDTDVVLLSDHGFGPLFKTYNLNQWFKKRRDLKRNPALPFWFVLNKALRLLNRVMRNIGISKRFEHVLRKGPETLIRGIDFKRSRAFALPTGVPFTGIYLIRKNIGDPERFAGELEKDLTALRDPTDDKKIVKQIYYRDDVFHGPRLHEMPDLMIEMADGYEVDTGTTLREGPDFKTTKNTGIHRINGIVVMAGPHIRADGSLKGAHIVDIAPTILELLGFPVPPEMDGAPLKAALHPTPMRKVESDLGHASDDEGDGALTIEDEQLVEQLRTLGYLE